jgi:hypothetical protein
VVLPGSIGSQTLNTSSSGNQRTLSISNGNSVTLNINDADSSSSNEIQTLSINGNTISLSNNGGSITLPTDQVNDADADSTNELQTLSISNDTLFLSNGGYVKLPQSANNLVSNTSGGFYDWIYKTGHVFVGNVYSAKPSDSSQIDLYNKVGYMRLKGNFTSGGSGSYVFNITCTITDDSGNILYQNNHSNYSQFELNQKLDGSISYIKIKLTWNSGNSNGYLSREFSEILLFDDSTTNYGALSSLTDLDQDSTNELQTLSKSNGIISLSNNGGSVVDSDNQILNLSGDTLSISGGNNIVLPSSTTIASTDTIHYGRNFFGFTGNTNGGNFSKAGPVDTIFNVQKGSTVKVFVNLSGVAFPTGSSGSCTIQWIDSTGQAVYGKYNISGNITLGTLQSLNMSQTSYNVEFEFVARRGGYYIFYGSASGFNQGGNTRGVTINTPIWQYSKNTP